MKTLKHIREKLQVPAEKVAEALGITTDSYMALEKAPNLAQPDWRARIAEAVGVDEDKISWEPDLSKLTLKEARERSNLTASAVAAYLKISLYDYMVIEEYPELVTIPMAQKLAVLYRTPLSDLNLVDG